MANLIEWVGCQNTMGVLIQVPPERGTIENVNLLRMRINEISSKRSPPSSHDERMELGGKNIPPLPASLNPSGKHQKASKQMMGPFMPTSSTKNKEQPLPVGFEYDPNLPMSYDLQIISFQTEQKQKQKLAEESMMEERAKMEHIHRMKASSTRQYPNQPQSQQLPHQYSQQGPRRQRSAEFASPHQGGVLSTKAIVSPQRQHSNSPPRPPTPPNLANRRGEIAHTPLNAQFHHQQNGPGGIIHGYHHPIKSEPEERYVSSRKGGPSTSTTSSAGRPSSSVSQRSNTSSKSSQQVSNKKPSTPSNIKRPSPVHVRNDDGITWHSFPHHHQPSPLSSHSPHPHTSTVAPHMITSIPASFQILTATAGGAHNNVNMRGAGEHEERKMNKQHGRRNDELLMYMSSVPNQASPSHDKKPFVFFKP